MTPAERLAAAVLGLYLGGGALRAALAGRWFYRDGLGLSVPVPLALAVGVALLVIALPRGRAKSR